MTFSIVARCATTGMVGVALSSSSIAVGARCPWVRAGIGAVSTQNITLPSLGPEILDGIEAGESGEAALHAALQRNGFNPYRQLAVVDAAGRAAVFTGSKALGTHHARTGAQCAAAGNLLKSPAVVDALVERFEATAGMPLADRLMCALEAGREAGGEEGPLHAAALLVSSDLLWPVVNLRVDWDDHDPIGRLRQLWTAYQPQADDYVTRALNPAEAPSYGVPGDV